MFTLKSIQAFGLRLHVIKINSIQLTKLKLNKTVNSSAYISVLILLIYAKYSITIIIYYQLLIIMSKTILHTNHRILL